MIWVEPQPVAIPSDLLHAAGGQALVAEALLRRGVETAEAAAAFLDPALCRLASPFDLPDMQEAVQRLRAAFASGERILVWGDFDADGLTATALLVESLRANGGVVDWYVPDRLRESHGVHWTSLQRFLGQGARVLVTCDTGVSAHEPLALAHNAGLDVIVTDHHALPPTLPTAVAIVNPSRLPSDSALRHLSGVGVAYKLAQALDPNQRGLDLTALGMIADVTTQRGDVRPMLQLGLRALRRAERVGVGALLEVADVDAQTLDEDTVGFALAPRLNALGRLASAAAGVELFLTQDLTRARVIAAEMEALNVRRQFLSRQVIAAAQSLLERQPQAAWGPVLVLGHAQWPSGVLGIAAGQLAQRYGRPVVLIATPPGEAARGSARSVPGIDIHAALSQAAALLSGFGGHPMAAGFSMPAERVPELRQVLTAAVAHQADGEPPERQLIIDQYVSLSELDRDLLHALRQLAPFGPGNPPVILAVRDVRLVNSRTIGRTGEHRRLLVQDAAGRTQRAVWWRSTDLPLPEGTFDLAFVLRKGRGSDESGLELEWLDTRSQQSAATELEVQSPAVQVADYRSVRDPLPMLRALWIPEEMQLWAEAQTVPGFKAQSRRQLQAGGTLIVWTTPPSHEVWSQVMHSVRPERVFLLAMDPDVDRVDTFLQRLAGLAKYGIGAYQGELDWEALAAGMSQHANAVRVGLRWLEARGVLTIDEESAGALTIRAGGKANPQVESAVRQELQGVLAETAAYRRHFRQADSARLVKDV